MSEFSIMNPIIIYKDTGRRNYNRPVSLFLIYASFCGSNRKHISELSNLKIGQNQRNSGILLFC